MRRLTIAGLLVLALLLATLGWLLSSERGLQWVYHQAAEHIPGEFEADRIAGRLAGPITLEKMRYRDDAQQVVASQLTLDWNPWALLGGELEIELFEADGLEVNLEPAPPAAEAEPPRVPVIELPLSISLQKLEIAQLRIIRGNSVTEIRRIESGMSLRQGQLGIHSLAIEAEMLQLNAQGTIEPGPNLAHDLGFDWSGRLPSGEAVQGQGWLVGNLERTRLEHRLDGALRAELRLEIKTLLTQLQWQAQLNLVDADSARIDVSLPRLSGNLRLDAQGDLQTFAASGDVELEQSPYGPLATRFRVQQITLAEAANGLTFAGLGLDLLQGGVFVDGAFDWAPQVQWRAQIATTGLNPSEILPQWPGRIDSRLVLNGALEDTGPVLSLDLERLEGELRGYPIRLRGRANWREDQAELRKVELSSGKSRVAVDGNLGQKLDLQWSLESGDLNELYPGAWGGLKAKGRLGGSFDSASITASLRGRSIGYADYAASTLDAELAFDLDLSQIAEPNIHRVDIDLEAGEIRLQQHRLKRLALKADDRRLIAEILADAGKADIELVGRLENDRWYGKLVEARLRSRDFGQWRLLAPAALSATSDQIGIDGFCFESPHNGRLCGTVEHRDASGEADLQLRNLPLELLQPWLPAEVSVAVLADADARLNYELPGRLLGQIDIGLQPGHVGYDLAPGQHQRVEFDDAGLKMMLAESGIDARLVIELGNGDGLQGSVNLPGANLFDLDIDSQDLQARLHLRLHDLGFIDSKFARIDRLRGAAEVDLDVTGSLLRPLVQGSARLDNAAFHIPELDLDITQMRIDVHSTDLRHLQYQLKANLADGKLALTGDTELDADSGWPSRISLAAQDLVITPLVRRHLPEKLAVDGRVSVNADLTLRTPDRILGSITIASPGGSLSYPLPNGESGHWNYRDVNLDLQLDKGDARAHGGFDIGDNKIQVKLHLPGINPFEIEPQSQALDGEVAFLFDDLSLLETLLPDLQNTRGSLQLNLRIGGNLAQPQLGGHAQLRQASLQVVRLGITLDQIDLTADTDIDGLLTFNASASSGNGKISLQGSSRLDQEQGWPTMIDVSGENFQVVRIPEAVVNLSPRLEVRLADNKIDVNGEIHVPYAKLQPRDVTTAARISNDVVIVGEEQERGGRWIINSSIRLILGERVTFFGYGFDGRLGGNLLIQEEPGKPTRGTGEITILKGRYRAYGQNLDVEQGRLLFTGGPLENPGLDISAVRKTGDVVAGIKASGSLQSPRLVLFSIPAMGETETLSYLLTGGRLDDASSDQGAMMAKAALALGLSGGDRIARSIGDRFGFDEMRIESSGSGDQASLVVGRYLLPGLYVDYGVGLIESINTLNLRYEVTESWLLEAESGAQHGADLLYRFER